MSRRSRISFVLLAFVVVVAIVLGINRRDRVDTVQATMTAAEALQGDTTGFARATGPMQFAFPEDHGPHPRFKTEWWYFTGNLRCADSDQPLGFQFTVFRTALTPEQPEGDSDWRTNQIYTAHLAVADSRAGVFRFTEKVSRGAVGLAGAAVQPFRVWVEDWEVKQVGTGPMQAVIMAATPEFAVELRIEPMRSPVLHGDKGFSPKSSDPGNASYYYSYTRLRTSGSLRLEDRSCTVSGTTWMDHEWSTSALGPTQVGWDWFALRLSDGRDLMYFQVREAEPDNRDPFIEGTVVAADGTVERLDKSDVYLTVTDSWTSPESGAEYPSGWRLEVPRQELVLDITPIMSDQELSLTVQYWEGAVQVEGQSMGQVITGEGYVELTGYSDKAFGEVSGNGGR